MMDLDIEIFKKLAIIEGVDPYKLMETVVERTHGRVVRGFDWGDILDVDSGIHNKQMNARTNNNKSKEIVDLGQQVKFLNSSPQGQNGQVKFRPHVDEDLETSQSKHPFDNVTNTLNGEDGQENGLSLKRAKFAEFPSLHLEQDSLVDGEIN